MMTDISKRLMKFLYKVIEGTKWFLNQVMPREMRFALKRLVPVQFSHTNIERIFIKEWQDSRKMYPWIMGSKEWASGVNLVGYLRAAKGIGEAARSSAIALDSAKIPYSINDYKFGIPVSQLVEILPTSQYGIGFKFNTNLIHIHPPQLPYLWDSCKGSDLTARYNIGVWYWELPELPKEWQFAFDLVDEVWVASQFVFDSISAKSPVPVIKIPPCIDPVCDYRLNRSDFNLPFDRFLFLCAYDVLSTQARKNPQGAIEAFKRAFSGSDTSVGLVIKVNNAQQNPSEIKSLRDGLRGYSNCYIIEEILDRSKMNALISLMDVYISLHRSEGFGLIPAEAMYFGKPVVMTKWSGNVDFMTEKNSCGVNYNLVPVGYNVGPYDQNQLWANPDIDHAAEYLHRLRTDSTYYAAVSQEAPRTIQESFSSQVIGNTIRSRLFDLGLA